MDSLPPQKQKPNVFFRILIGVCGIIAIVSGISQMRKGVGEIQSAHQGPEVKQLLDEIESAVKEGNQSNADAAPLFQNLLNSTDKDGLAAVRKAPDAAQKVAELFGTSVKQFKLAGAKSSEAAGKEANSQRKEFLNDKARAYELIAQSAAVNQEIVQIVMDESKTKMEDVVAEVQAAGKRRDALQKDAHDAEAQATAAMQGKKSP